MTVGELMEELQRAVECGLDPDETEVRLAIQPSWPFEHSVERVVLPEEIATVTDGEVGEDTSREIVYLAEGGQISYLRGLVAEVLGW